jgi:hypothetical protein
MLSVISVSVVIDLRESSAKRWESLEISQGQAAGGSPLLDLQAVLPILGSRFFTFHCSTHVLREGNFMHKIIVAYQSLLGLLQKY